MKVREAHVRRYASSRSFERGRECLNSGAARVLINSSNRIVGSVEGNGPAPYRVEAVFDESGDILTHCDCAFEGEGWCKHVVAVLLVASAHSREPSSKEASIAGEIADLADFEHQALLADACREVPAFVTFARQWLGMAAADGQRKPAQRGMLALARTPDLSLGRAPDGNLARLLDRALFALDRERIGDATADLEKVTSFAAPQFEDSDDSDGDFGEFIRSLGRVWIDAALMFDGAAARRRALAKRVAAFRDHFDDYGVGDELRVAALVLEEESEARANALLASQPELLDELRQAHLRVLARRGQAKDYLTFARKIGARISYLTMLLCLGETERAGREAVKLLKTPSEVLRFGRRLEEERPEDALKLAELALDMRGERCGEVAYWARDLALEHGKRALALRAAKAAVVNWPTLEAYRSLKSIAGKQWKCMRAEVLNAVKKSQNVEEAIQVLIEEGLVAEAIPVLEQPHVYVSYETLEAIVQSAIRVKPDWALRTACEQAERIMSPGKSEYYHHAARWLHCARAAYEASDRAEEWRAYRVWLLGRHKRKYKLVAILKGL
ncbi:MAG TPA: hypothetical protein VIX83_13840 [Candidatus Cybelea sp.]